MFKKKKKQEDSDEDTDDESDDEVPAGSTIVTKNIQSLRMDAIYKAAFNLSRKYAIF